jgi:hypothetical protein
VGGGEILGCETPQHYRPTVPAKTVSKQPHYTALDPQPIDVAEAWGLMEDAERFSALKYIARAPHKDSLAQDIAKACDYLLRRLKREGASELLTDLAAAASRYAGVSNEQV